ncbi:MAG: alkaline phosphatase family protein, partial [Acidobacteria bacterium]|nr:alkaline phosphatase family protein [Acidobacteriota bacterium]
IERFVAERNPATGESLLPAIKRVFYDNGTVAQNFYTRGLSLSAPSWSLLDTGQHLQIKGNVEYDRFTLRTYDYLNFFPFYVDYFRSRQVDKIGSEVLDSMNIPLLFDVFDYRQRYQSYQLFQRGARWTTLSDAAQSHFKGKSLGDLMGEWAGGRDFRGIMTEGYERDVIARLNDPNIRYLDIFTAEFDHVAHLNRDRASLLAALQNLDAMVGRVWQAIERSPLRDETVLVLLSDHSLNTDERVYSQGYNLISLFNSAAGGAHHVVTHRHPLGAYQLKSLNPMTDIIVSESKESFYLKGEASKYPTALMDLDGNERAAIHLRNSDLNALHMLLLQLKDKKLLAEQRAVMTQAFFQIVERSRPRWTKTLNELTEELNALRRFIAQQEKLHRAQPKKFSATDKDAGLDKESRRIFARLHQAQEDDAAYSAYLRTLQNLLALQPFSFNPSKVKVETLIAPRAMGEPNSIHQLQNYVANLSSSVTVNYFSLLTGVKVRNNVQAGVGSRPVDFVAVRIPCEEITTALNSDEQTDQDAIWLYGGEDRQALILARNSATGDLWLRYLPIAGLQQDTNGQIRFRRVEWQSNLPLKLWEDEKLNVVGDRADWLGRWQTELDWLRAIHRAKYANGLIGLHEQLSQHEPPPSADDSPDGKLLRRFWLRQRRLAEADLLVLASDHWNFNVRDFNPGGNHGSLFRVSTHSTLMFAGGNQTGIPKASLITEPYDSLSFVPTIFALMKTEQQRGFQSFPGQFIKEVLSR